MSITGKFQPNQHRLLITGDDADNSITVSRDLGGRLFANGETIDGEPTVANTDLIRVNGGDGNDVITLDQSNGALPAAELSGGNGNDIVTGGSGNDELLGQDGNDFLFGRAGNDRLVGGDGDDFLDGDQGADIGFLGAGNDVFRWDPGDGSDIVEGGSGFDEMLFNGASGAEQFTLSANGERSSFTRVQGNIVMDMDDVELVTVNALGGADTITINDPSGTDISDIAINLGVGGTGDGAADTIFINDDDVSVVDNGNGSLTLLGLAGATVHITGFEVLTDQLFIDGVPFVF